MGGGADLPYATSLFISFSFISMASGIIKKILEKGFGFISVEGMEDVFFHMSACNGQFESLREGQSVQFEVEDGPKGKKAVNVTAI